MLPFQSNLLHSTMIFSILFPRNPPLALLQVITPRSSSWPRKYTSLAKWNNSLQLPLKFVIQDILAGEIELRSPNETLQRILSANGQLQIDTWHLFLSYGMLWPVIIYRSFLWTVFPGTYLASARCIFSNIAYIYTKLPSHLVQYLYLTARNQ